MNALLMMHSLMKSAVVDFNRGKEECLSMDDELPLIIILLAKSNYPDILVDINLIEDFMLYESHLYESEQRLLMNIRVK